MKSTAYIVKAVLFIVFSFCSWAIFAILPDLVLDGFLKISLIY